MLILTAEGESPDHNDTWQVVVETPMVLGRSADNDYAVPWDHLVSRKHAEVTLNGQSLSLRCLPGTRNPIWYCGRSHQEATIAAGESFQIGRTRFTLSTSVRPLAALQLVDAGEGQEGHKTSTLMSPSDIRMAVVSQNATALWMATDEKELAQQALLVLQQVLTGADLLVTLNCEDVQSANRPRIIHWQKTESGLQASISRDLIYRAMKNDETAIQVESDANGEPVKTGWWSFCVPVRSEASTPWCIYVGGTFGGPVEYPAFLKPQQLKPDAGVTELVAHLMGAVRSVRALENRFEGMRRFFSPRLLDAIASDGPDGADLAPRETDIVAIYCDLRGFSRMVAKSTDDLHGLLRRISAALGIMTQSIIEQQGVIADFQGDSALGFWGWPIALMDGPVAACRAALQIRQFFELAADDGDAELDGFEVGIGIATGRAIAGRIGTRDQAKIGIFGPVVNIASRLEGITKKVGVAILMDESTASAARRSLPQNEGRCRPIGVLQPAGFDQPVAVSELLPPVSQSIISDIDVENFRNAVQAFRKGHWKRCRKLLSELPAEDKARDFLLVAIASHNYQPPAGWSGIITMDSK
ncbi:MAG: adenylate/guanylate cyclase domain-containing protein [Fuerstiella sp.]|jgi:adenylate cyclase|nr:adenylate/guanylate cyclase domain-containing protein [Fuerstiella sp.]